MAKATKSKKQAAGASNASFDAQIWAAADALRNNMDAPEYQHVVLGLIFLKYLSDASEAKHKEPEGRNSQAADPETEPASLGSCAEPRRLRYRDWPSQNEVALINV